MHRQLSRFLAVAVAVAVAVAATLLAFAATARAQTAINVYGPGGPAPAMKEAAAAFASEHKITVNVVAGPTPQWAGQAKQDADVIFSGAENMMFDFAKVLPGVFDLRQVYPHYGGRPPSLFGPATRSGYGACATC